MPSEHQRLRVEPVANGGIVYRWRDLLRVRMRFWYSASAKSTLWAAHQPAPRGVLVNLDATGLACAVCFEGWQAVVLGDISESAPRLRASAAA
jgi:hypothetical protein